MATDLFSSMLEYESSVIKHNIKVSQFFNQSENAECSKVCFPSAQRLSGG